MTTFGCCGGDAEDGESVFGWRVSTNMGVIIMWRDCQRLSMAYSYGNRDLKNAMK